MNKEAKLKRAKSDLDTAIKNIRNRDTVDKLDVLIALSCIKVLIEDI